MTTVNIPSRPSLDKDMVRKLEEIAAKHDIQGNSGSDTFKQVLEKLIETHDKYHGLTGIQNDTVKKIDDCIEAQMSLNKETDKTTVVGYGKKATTIKYEQRSITGKWIMDTANVTWDSVLQYLEANKEKIFQHNKWLCKDNGWFGDEKPADWDTVTADDWIRSIDWDNRPKSGEALWYINNFNRRTGKATKAEEKKAALSK